MNDFNVRTRLFGAVILLALTVIFIPMLLEKEPPDRFHFRVEIPPEPATIARPKPRIYEAPEPIKPLVTPVPVTEPSQQPVLSTKKPPVNTGQDQWIVQVASFSKRSNAEGVAEKLTAKGLKANVEAIQAANQRTVFRVLIGPFNSEATALTNKKKTESSTQFKPLVIRISSKAR